MIDIGLIHILDPKSIHDECECDRARFMIPEARCIEALVIPKRGQFSAKAIVSEDTHLWKAQDSALHFKVYPSVLGILCKIILFNDPDGKQVERHFHILKVFKGSGEIEIYDVETHILAFGVLRTLFQCNFAVLISTVQTLKSPFYMIRFPTAVIRMQFGSSFWGW
jgi:hypothetical protein